MAKPDKMTKDPIEQIQWLYADELNANDYNPNVVYRPELKLLERSLLLTGWVQPVLVSKDKIIIDGFHRVMLSKTSKELIKRYAKRVPCAVLDITRHQAMILTIRFNRAKGSHIAFKMADVVKELVKKHRVDRKLLADEIGATVEEIDLLLQDNVFTKKISAKHSYSKAWYPER